MGNGCGKGTVVFIGFQVAGRVGFIGKSTKFAAELLVPVLYIIPKFQDSWTFGSNFMGPEQSTLSCSPLFSMEGEKNTCKQRPGQKSKPASSNH